MTGIDCPGCGMQRAFIALLKGEFALSVSLNPSLIPFLMTLFFAFGHILFGFRNGAKLIVIFFSITVLIMLLNFVVKLLAVQAN